MTGTPNNLDTSPPAVGELARKRRRRRPRRSKRTGVERRSPGQSDTSRRGATPNTDEGRPQSSSLVIRWLPRCTLIAGLVLVSLYALRPIDDPDVWWHLKMGERIVETGAIPRVDEFSHTAAGKPLVAHEWLSQVVFHLAERSFGLDGVRGLNAVAAIALLLVLWRQCWQMDHHPIVATAVWGACVTLCMPYMTWRPQIFSMTIVVLLLPRILFPQRVSYSAGRVLLVTLGFWFWANLHSMVCIGVFLLALSWITVCATHFLRRNQDTQALPRNEQRLPVLMGVQLLAVSIAVALTPNGTDIYWFATVGARLSSNSSLRIVEWLPGAPVWWSIWRRRLFGAELDGFRLADLHAIIAAGAIVILLWHCWRACRSRSEHSLTGLALAGLCTLAAIESRRASWLLVLGIIWVASAAHRTRKGEKPTRPAILSGRRLSVAGATLLLCVALPTWGREIRWAALARGTPVRSDRYPVGAADFIHDVGLETNLYNDYGWGGYLIYRLHPECRVFIHGEHVTYERFAHDVVEDYLNVRREWKRMPMVFRRQGVDLCISKAHRLSERQPGICMHRAESALRAPPPFVPPGVEFHSPWVRIFANREASLYLNVQSKRGWANLRRCREFYARFGITLTRESGIDMGEVLRAAPEFARQYRVVHDGFESDQRLAKSESAPTDVLLRLGDSLLRIGLAAEAGQHFARALQRNPHDVDALVGAADAAHDQKDYQRARVLAIRANTRWPHDARTKRLARHMRSQHGTGAVPHNPHEQGSHTHDPSPRFVNPDPSSSNAGAMGPVDSPGQPPGGDHTRPESPWID